MKRIPLLVVTSIPRRGRASRRNCPYFVLGFGQDLSGEVYALTTDSVGPAGTTGKVFRLMPSETVAREDETELPARVALEQNYPNPFNPETTIRFHLAAPAHVRLTVYDMIGRDVARLFDGQQTPGDHMLRWDGRNEAGRLVPSGAYLYRLEAGRFTESKVMTLLK